MTGKTSSGYLTDQCFPFKHSVVPQANSPSQARKPFALKIRSLTVLLLLLMAEDLLDLFKTGFSDEHH